MSVYYVRRSEPSLWTVGIGEGDDWHPESDHPSDQEARERAVELNGGAPISRFERLEARITHLEGLSLPSEEEGLEEAYRALLVRAKAYALHMWPQSVHADWISAFDAIEKAKSS